MGLRWRVQLLRALIGLVATSVAAIALLGFTFGRQAACAIPSAVIIAAGGWYPEWIPGCAGLPSYESGYRGLDRSDLRNALRAFDGSAAKLPGWAPVHVGRGTALEYLGEFDAAMAAFQTAVAIDPTAAHRRHVAQIAVRMGRFDVALDAFERGAPTRPEQLAAAIGGGLSMLVTCGLGWLQSASWTDCPRLVLDATIDAWHRVSRAG